MKSEGKKTPSPLRYLCGILAVWTVLIGFSKFAGGRAGSGSIRIPAAALLLIVIPAAVIAISRLGTLCAYMRSHSGALRRGTALLCALALSLSAFTLPAEAAVSGSLSDANIGWSESEFSAGTPGTGTATSNTASSSWAASGTQITGTVTPAESSATSGGGCGGSTTSYYYSSEATSTLTITNQNAEKSLLTFSYTVPSAGTLTIDGTAQTKASSFSKTLDPNGTILIKLTTQAKPALSTSSNPSAYAASATLSNLSLTSLNRDISVTFAQPAHGSYTVKAGSTALKVGETYTKPVTTQYTLSARADANYVFDGWYVNDTKVSVAATYTAVFSDDCTVEARFAGDPLFSVIQMSDPAADKSAYVEASSSYYHNEKGSYHTNVGDTSQNNSYGPHTYFPYSTWSASNGAIQSSESGTATGDNQTTWGYSQASATLYSDIIRVKCKENCIITFDSSMNAQSVSISNSNSSDNQYGVFLYYYTTASASANANTIKTNGTAAIEGSKKTSGSASTRVVVNKDEYLYLYAYAKTRKDKMTNSGYETDNYSYTATISNFTVTPNTTEHTFTTGNRDNTGTVLKSGSVKINGTAQGVSSGTYSYKAADNATLTLTPGTAPTGYTFIGWHNVTDNVYDYTNSTYTVKMTKDYEVNPIYVPAMTITTGTNGYENATYQYKALNGQMVTPTNLFVARGPIPSNGEKPAFYTSLKDAFAAKDNTVFLLAEDTINGDLTIPAGKTLVIPDRFAAKGPDLQTGLPEQYDPSASISSYCKVTLNGNLTVNGKLVVNGMQSSTANGRAAGSIGYLSLSDSAAVTVSSGGELCGYGQIRGGSISAENGSTVRELMEISDRRAALVMQKIDAEKSSMRVFPFSNFSIKTIESPVTYASGAKLYAQYSIMLEGNNQSTGAVLIFGPSGALFNLTQGSMTKSFDLAADKTVYRLNEGGKMSTGSFQLDVKFSAMGMSKDITIKSQEYWMPLNAGFDLRTAGDMTVNSDFKFLPGASLSVEKGGTCTVASSAKLLFYRLNDYDTRKIGNGIYQKGYSAKAYPVNATNLPGGGYKHPMLDTVGSARLNVDGDMIVKGGLYVSDDLVSKSYQGYNENQKEIVDGVAKTRREINEADFTVYDNGYNVLTGTGSIDMTAAQTTETQVHEAMTAQGTNDPAWAPIKITPIAGLNVDASADAPKNYKPFDQKATYYGVHRPGNFYVWTTEKPEIAKIVGGGNETIYRSLADAVQAYTGTGYIQMLKNSTEPGFTVSKDVTLDLNGKTVKLASPLTVAEGKTLSGMDSSAGVDYVTAPGGKIVGTVTGTVAPTYQTPTVKVENVDTYDRYVAISGLEADGKTANLSFHHFNISVTGYRFELAAPQCALFFIGTFRGDDAAKAYLSKLGFTLKGNNDMSLGEADYVFTADTVIPPESEPGDSPVVLSGDAYLFEVYLNRSFKKDEPNGYTEKIGATAQATFKNGGTQNSETKQWSFEDAWTESEGLKDLTPEQKAILDKFLKELGITKQAE